MDSRRYLPTRQELIISTLLWLALGLWLGMERAAFARFNHSSVGTLLIYKDAILEHVILAAIAPMVLVAARVFPFERRNLLRNVTVHILLFALYTALHVLLGAWMHLPLPGAAKHAYGFAFVVELYYDAWMYALIVVTWSMVSLSRRYREEEKRSSQLRVRLAEAELATLRAQMQPHFLFNTLNSISCLMHSDVAAADDMIADLSFMLRRSLEHSCEAEVTLEEEMELLKTYVRIQKRRFGDRLMAGCVIPEELRMAAVPSLMLQTFVENSIRHGLAPRSAGGHVQMSVSREGHRLRIEIRDDGVGFETNIREGIGIANSRERLRQMYGDDSELRLSNLPHGGAQVIITLPLRMLKDGSKEYGSAYLDSRRRALGTRAHSVTAE